MIFLEMGDPGPSEDKPARKAITVLLPTDLLDQVQKLRREDGRSLTEFVRRALASAVELGERYSPLRQGRRR